MPANTPELRDAVKNLYEIIIDENRNKYKYAELVLLQHHIDIVSDCYDQILGQIDVASTPRDKLLAVDEFDDNEQVSEFKMKHNTYEELENDLARMQKPLDTAVKSKSRRLLKKYKTGLSRPSANDIHSVREKRVNDVVNFYYTVATILKDFDIRDYRKRTYTARSNDITFIFQKNLNVAKQIAEILESP